MTVRLAKQYTFEAAHALPGHSVAGERHGHSYRVVVVCAVPGTSVDGLVIDDVELDRLFNEAIIQDRPYFDLDTVMPADWLPSSVENVASWIFYVMDEALPTGLLERVRVHETATRWAEVERDHCE